MFNEFFEDLDMDLLDIVNEASKQKDLKSEVNSSLITIYEHMIKYQYNPKRQSKSWVLSILREYKTLPDINKLRKCINDNDLDKAYFDGRNKAIKSDTDNIVKKLSPENRPYNWNLELISDINQLTDFLRIYYNYDNVYAFDLEEFIRKGLS